MATAKFTPRKKTASTNPAPVRKRVAAATDDGDDGETQDSVLEDEQVEVFVKKGFKFTTDDHVVHDIPEGTQDVPRSWLEHSYFVAHGVRETEKRK